MNNIRQDAEQLAILVSSFPELEELMLSATDKKVALRDWIAKNSKGANIDSDAKLRISLMKEIIGRANNSQYSYAQVNEYMNIDNDDELKEFIKDLNESKVKGTIKDQFEFHHLEIQHYKTITEKIAFEKFDFSRHIHNYTNSSHPYINNKIAQLLLNAKYYKDGIYFLLRALQPVFSLSNNFWHSPLGIQACTEAMYELQHLLGSNGILELANKSENAIPGILELVELYLCRSIAISKWYIANFGEVNNYVANIINDLTLLGDLYYHYKELFANIHFGVNPVVQTFGLYLEAYNYGIENGLDIIVQSLWKDALKLYQHGSLIPNCTGGLCESEDETFFELANKAQKRKELLAEQIFTNFDFSLLNNATLNTVNIYLTKKYVR